MNPEKKKVAVMVALFAVVIGVGAFQFMNASSAPPPAPTQKKDAKTAEGENAQKQGPLNAGLPALAQRDPFVPAAFMTQGDQASGNPTVTPSVEKKPVQSTHGNPKLGFNTKGPFGDEVNGGLPPAGGTKGEVPPMEVTKPVFGYTLVGVVEGRHPAAVFDDGKGNQQLVEIGQSVGPDAKILTISRGVVRVKFNAETLTLNVGGNPNAK